MKTGIFGGTFNPPHSGHVKLCENMAKALGLDKIIVIPACIPPHKAALSLAKDEMRLAMCRAAFKGTLFEVSDIELKRGGKSYTVETLREIKKQRPGDELYFITGSDMFSSFHTWYRPKEILSLAFLAVAARENSFSPDFSPYTQEEKERIKFVNLPVTVLSSTEVRQKIRYKQDLTSFLSQGVIDIINTNALYDDGLYEYRKLLLTKLDKKRIFHSECVSESACQLALQYGADKDKAAKAGLLHDIMKNALDEEHLKYIPSMTALEKVSRPVWHQMSAPGFLRENNIVTDEEILKAISTHTTGSAGMTTLQKVVYVADFISADRDYPDVDTVRKLSRSSLEKAILYTARYTVNKMLSLDKPVHPLTLDCYNEMIILMNDERK